MAKVISQETYDEVIGENIVMFSMSVEEARQETIEQFEAQVSRRNFFKFSIDHLCRKLSSFTGNQPGEHHQRPDPERGHWKARPGRVHREIKGSLVRK